MPNLTPKGTHFFLEIFIIHLLWGGGSHPTLRQRRGSTMLTKFIRNSSLENQKFSQSNQKL